MRRIAVLSLAVALVAGIPAVGSAVRADTVTPDVATRSPGTLARFGGFAGSTGILWESNAAFNRDLDAMANAGAKWLRVDFDWPSAEPQHGVYRWSAIDRVV